MSGKNKNGKNKKKLDDYVRKQMLKIRTRLIELSVKLEDLVYNKKPISAREAEGYLVEVNSYQQQCNNDERSMQVIEKLTRCMNTIIAEENEQNINYLKENIDSVRATSISPVYSLPDEDRTQFTQEIQNNLPPNDTTIHFTQELPKSFTNLSCIKEVQEFSLPNHDRSQFTQQFTTETRDTDVLLFTQEKMDLEHENYEKDIINISSDDDEESKGVLRQETEDFNIHKALSNLSLKDEIFPNTECSQSILKDYQDLNKTQNTIVANTSKNDSIKTVKVNDALRNERYPIKNVILNKYIIPIITNKTNTNNTIAKNNNMHNILVLQGSNTQKAITSKSISTTESNATNSNIQQKHLPVKANVIKIQKSLNTTQAEIKNKDITNNNKENKQIIPKKTRRPRKKGIQTTNDIVNNDISKTSGIRRKRTKQNFTQCLSVPIYNKKVDNDLSWLESIKYVRIIEDNELDRKLVGLEEGFWNNYDLPAVFDDHFL